MNLRACFRLGMMVLALLCGLERAGAAEPLNVVASIKPIHALVAGVMAGAGTPTLLVTGNASPHDYALKPSAMRALETARLVFWMGPTIEGFLPRPLKALGGPRSVALGEQLGDRLLPLRSTLERHDNDKPRQDNKHFLPDLHAWLDPDIAAAMVEIIARELGVADPERAALYAANAATLKSQLKALDAELEATLSPAKDRAYIVFHDAYQYFERRYGLSGLGSLALHTEAPPGAKHLVVLRARIESGEARCVFAEPQFDAKLVHALIEGSSARSATLDPLGSDLPDVAESYFTLMRRLATSFAACLAD